MLVVTAEPAAIVASFELLGSAASGQWSKDAGQSVDDLDTDVTSGVDVVIAHL